MLALDNVAQYIDSVGTDDTQSMSGAVPGYRTVAQMLTKLGLSGAIGVCYRIEDGDQWEIGIGIVDGAYLERERVTAAPQYPQKVMPMPVINPGVLRT